MVNCPITIDDVKRFNMVNGKNAAEIKGKMTKPSNIDQKAVIIDHLRHKYLLLHCDVMYANNLPFLISVAKPINQVLCSELSDRSSKAIFLSYLM